MGVYKYLRNLWKKPSAEIKNLQRERLMKWRREPATVRVERPLRLDRAHALGYKAKPGYLVIRQRVRKGGRQRPQFKKGRRSKHMRRKKVLDQSLQILAEQRVARKYTNCEVLNSYWVGKEKMYVWYEVIVVDRTHKAVLNDLPHLKKTKGRALRGLTSAGKKSRGLRNKGRGAEKVRGMKGQHFG